MPSSFDVFPKDVLELEAPTKGFLCPLSANRFGLDFLQFEIYDYETKRLIFEVGRDSKKPPIDIIKLASMDEDSLRKIRYEFSEDVLRLPTIQTSLTFSVGPKELKNLRMIERHYFQNRLIKSYDFTFGFCIPGSTNTWDAVYDVPPLDEQLISQIVKSPYETTSDSFYFVNDELIMHNKAEYKYVPSDRAEAKDSGSRSERRSPGQKGSKGDDDDDAKSDAKSHKRSDIKWSKEDDYK